MARELIFFFSKERHLGKDQSSGDICYRNASVCGNRWEYSARLLHVGTQLLVLLQASLVVIAAFVFLAAGYSLTCAIRVRWRPCLDGWSEAAYSDPAVHRSLTHRSRSGVGVSYRCEVFAQGSGFLSGNQDTFIPHVSGFRHCGNNLHRVSCKREPIRPCEIAPHLPIHLVVQGAPRTIRINYLTTCCTVWITFRCLVMHYRAY